MFLNFAYGSNMSIVRLRRRTPSARVVRKGFLAGHRLAWHKRGRDASAKCDAHRTDQDDDRVWGAVMAISEREREALHRAEGLGHGYEEKLVRVETSVGSMEAHVYYATDIDEALRPFDWYKRHVLRGARELGLPEDYIETIAGVPAVVDPDRDRARREHPTSGGTMANEGFHEEVSDLSEATRDMHRAIQSLMEELEAVDWYNQRVDACKDQELKAILVHNRDEEKEHAAMVLEWIRRQDATFSKELKDYLFTEKSIARLESGHDG